jgi:membrane associated rhomboid family serine protease
MIRGPAKGLEDLIGVRVAVEAHLYGALAGALVFALLYRPRRRPEGR